MPSIAIPSRSPPASGHGTRCRTSVRGSMRHRPRNSPSSGTTRKPRSGASTSCAGALCRIGQRTPRSPTRRSTRAPKALRASRPSGMPSRDADALSRPMPSSSGRRPGAEAAIRDQPPAWGDAGVGRSLGEMEGSPERRVDEDVHRFEDLFRLRTYHRAVLSPCSIDPLGRIDIYRSHVMVAARWTKPLKWMVRRS
jgi:hypothetical protein